MENPMPYYMAYKNPVYTCEDRRNRIDYEYMKDMYPDTARRLMPYIEEECERMGYQGSMIYDEFPDRLQIRLMCVRVCDRAREKEKIPRRWMMDMVEIMICQELCRRRCEKRNMRRIY